VGRLPLCKDNQFNESSFGSRKSCKTISMMTRYLAESLGIISLTSRNTSVPAAVTFLSTWRTILYSKLHLFAANHDYLQSCMRFFGVPLYLDYIDKDYDSVVTAFAFPGIFGRFASLPSVSANLCLVSLFLVRIIHVL
jgi:hypothetical protein